MEVATVRQVCPKCMNSVEVPESASGTDFACPQCGVPFAIPKVYSPAVSVPAMTSDRPLPPPGFTPSVVIPPTLPTANAPGELREVGFQLSPKTIAWIPIGLLTFAFILTFFTWIGAYPGGNRVFAQSPWDALFAGISPNNPPAELESTEKKLEELIHSNWLLLPYFVLLIGTLFIGWVERFIQDPDVRTLPGPLAWLPKIWPQRFAFLTLLTVVLFLLVTWTSIRGFGLETAIREMATQTHADEIAAADTATKKVAAQVKFGQTIGKFALQSTTFHILAIASHFFAVIFMLVRVWLNRRGAKPVPQLVMRY